MHEHVGWHSPVCIALLTPMPFHYANNRSKQRFSHLCTDHE